jgi:hypothetical protein
MEMFIDILAVLLYLAGVIFIFTNNKGLFRKVKEVEMKNYTLEDRIHTLENLLHGRGIHVQNLAFEEEINLDYKH